MNTQAALIESFETEEGTTRLYENGLIEITIREGAYIDVPYLLAGKARLDQTGISNFYVIAEAQGFCRISRKARELNANKEFSSNVRATAIVATHLFVKLIIEMYLSIDKPATPTRSFTDREFALLWLKEQMQADIGSPVA